MSANFDSNDINEANAVSVDRSGNEALTEIGSNLGLFGESVVDGVRVFGEGNEGLRVQMEGLDACNVEGQMGFLGNVGVDIGVKVVDRSCAEAEMENEATQVSQVENIDDGKLDGNMGMGEKRSDQMNVEIAEIPIGDDIEGFSYLARDGTGTNVVDMYAQENEILEMTFGHRIDNQGTNMQDIICGEEQLTEAELKNGDGIGRRDEHRMEEEGKYYVSDLVWGKVRSHPWWPGQIFDPSAASEKALKHFKKDSYLIAYFGDQTFAWNEASHIKPFRMYFSQMEKQINSEAFSHALDCALDEVSRRAEFGLACSCLLKEARANIKSQIVVNAGIRAESSIIVGGDEMSNATSFNPAAFVRLLKSAAEASRPGISRLSFVLARAQLLAFNRWRGYYELPVIEEFGELLGNDNHVEPLQGKEDASEVVEGVVPEENTNIQGTFPTKHPRCSQVDERPGKRGKPMPVLLHGSSSSLKIDQKRSRGRAGWKRKSTSSDKKPLTFDSIHSDSKVKRREKVLSPRSGNKMSSPTENFSAIGEQVHKAGNQVLKSSDTNSQRRIGERSEKSRNDSVGDSILGPMEPEREKLILKEFPPSTEMLSKLSLAARDPMNGHKILISLATYFCDYRNSTCLETTVPGDHKKSIGKDIGKNSSNPESAETLPLEGIEDSYWTDRIIQGNLEDQVLFEPEVINQKDSLGPSSYLDNEQEGCGLVKNLESENLSGLVDENSEEYSPTALILNFSDLESVSAIADLNKIFSQYGPLSESETEVLDKSKRAKVVFKRRSDAETAFSKSGKFSVFGPSLISYRLQYSPTPRKPSCTSKRKRKDAGRIQHLQKAMKFET